MTDLTDSVKERLKYYVEQAVNDIYVSTNWNIDLVYSKSYPAATVKLEPIIWREVVYGKKVPEDGAMVEIHFSIWVADEEDRSYLDEHPSSYSVMDVADEICDYLITISGNETERTSYNIHRIYDITVDSGGSKKTGRPRAINIMVIEGKIWAKWLD